MTAEAPVSPESFQALTARLGKLKMLEDFINRYEQQYHVPTGKNVRDPRTDPIFTMLKTAALGYYEVGSNSGNSYIAADALVLGIAPHVPQLQSAYDVTTGLMTDAAVAAADKLNLYCYVLSDPRSKVSSDIKNVITELGEWLGGDERYDPMVPPPAGYVIAYFCL